MGGIWVGEVRRMHPFGVKMEEPVETKRREHRRRKKLRLDWEERSWNNAERWGKREYL